MTGDARAYGVVWFGQFAAVAGLTVVVPLLPFHLAGLGAAPADVPWWTAACLAAPAATQIVSGPLWGSLGDRWGRRAMVVRAHLGLALAVGLMALARTPGEFLACRLAQGAFGGVAAATAAYAATLSPPHRRGRALGDLFGATAAGSLIGPLAGGVAAGTLGYEVVFAAVAVMLAVAGLLASVVLREPAPGRATALTTVTAPAVRQAVSALLTAPAGRAVLLAGLAAQAGVFALVVLFAPQVARATGSPAAAATWVGVLQAATWAASLPGARFWGARGDRRSGRSPHGRGTGRELARGLVPASVGLAVAVVLQAVPVEPELLLPMRLVQGFCMAAVVPAVLHTTTQLVAEPVRGAALGVSTGMLDLGQVLGPPIAALAVSLTAPPAAFGVVGALFVVAGALAALGARRSAPLVPA